jgi:hypothetical protein
MQNEQKNGGKNSPVFNYVYQPEYGAVVRTRDYVHGAYGSNVVPRRQIRY